MKRPLVWTLAFYAAGVLCARYAGRVSLTLTAAAAVLSVLILLCLKLATGIRAAVAAVFFISLLAGFIFMERSLARPYAPPGEAFEGTLTGLSLTASGSRRAVMRTEHGGRRFDMLVYMPDGFSAEPGQRAVLYGSAEPLEHARNPGGFDEFNYYGARKISCKLFADSAELKPGGVSIFAGISAAFVSVRERLAAVYDGVLPEKEAGIMKAVIIGDKSSLGDSVKELYKAAGIYHILAISGLHVSIVAAGIGALLKKFMNYKAGGAAALALVVGYCLLTGSAVSTVRAAVMFGVVVAGELLDRERDTLTSISFACLCLLVYEPMYIFDAGFQLSFSAVYGLCLFAGPVEMALLRLGDAAGGKLFPLRVKAFTSLLSATAAATLATAPVQCFHFYYFYPYAVVTNMIVLPSVFIVVGLGIAVGVAGLLSLSAVLPLAGTLYYILNFYERVGGFLSVLPGSELLTGRPAIITCGAVYALALAAAYLVNGGRRGFRERGKFALAALGLLCITTCFRLYEKSGLTVTMLDVGQGDCAVIERGGGAFVIDGGGQWGREHGSNTGVNVLIPFLDYKGVRRLDGVFVTHGDSDHAAGIAELFEYGGRKIGALCVSPYESGGDLLNLAAEHKIITQLISEGDSLAAGELKFECLYPPENFAGASVNEASLVLRLKYKDTSFLFTGDIGEDAEGELVERYAGATLASDILKVPHHGSKYSSSGPFVAAVNPAAALLSAGVNNVYGFPSSEAMAVYAEYGVPVFVTKDLGAVEVVTDGEEYAVGWMLEEAAVEDGNAAVQNK